MIFEVVLKYVKKKSCNHGDALRIRWKGNMTIHLKTFLKFSSFLVYKFKILNPHLRWRNQNTLYF